MFISLSQAKYNITNCAADVSASNRTVLYGNCINVKSSCGLRDWKNDNAVLTFYVEEYLGLVGLILKNTFHKPRNNRQCNVI